MAPTALAQSYELVQADVQAQVEADGGVAVEERISVAFGSDFPFTYGFREIPYRSGERISDIAVLENGRTYGPGASTDLEPGGPAGTFGIRDLGGRIRVVWRFQATGEMRTFTIRYRFSGLAIGYEDVVDVNLKVWGDEWEQSLGRLTSTTSGPGRIVRAWGHPVWVRGDVTLAGPRALLRAIDVPAGQFVELRAVYPRATFSSTTGMRVEDGPGLAKIVAEEQADTEEYARDQERIDALKDNPVRTALIVLALATLPALLVIAAVFWLVGRERRTAYDREYEQEPPTDTEPALVPTLLRQGGEAGSYEFTATLFDLIRRGVYTATPATTERKIWGGLRTQTVSDLELSAGERADLTPWEHYVAEVIDAVLDGGSERLSNFRDRIEDERESMSGRFDSFKAAIGREADRRSWFRSLGAVPLVGAGVLLALVGALLFFLAQDGWRSVYPRYSDVVLIGVGISLIVNAALLGATVVFGRRLWRRRSPPAQTEAERWDAFRHYLTDFPRLQEAPPAT
ncbi:MAG: DUF2207 domain-containing protein, partial [Actinomycetota bacterium]|nr:DUF2207 domain-containing protein [Actinomycetota bacterium]